MSRWIPSQANTAQTLQRSLIIGQMLAAGAATPDVPLEVELLMQVQTACGRGSILCQMAQAYLTGDNFGDLWLLPLTDNLAGQPATGTVSIGGAATAPGTLNLYVGGILVQAPVYLADIPATIATALVDACLANPDLAVTAAGVGGVVTFTANNAGETGNDIDLRVNYYGQAGGEYTPAGITVTIVPMAGGTGNPGIGNGLANLSDQTYDFIVTPYTDAPNLDALEAF